MKLEVMDLSFSYDKSRRIFEAVSFQCEDSQILCILGENGAGKSTLLNCILGEEQAEGKILIDQKYLADYSARELAKKIAYIPQSHTPIFPFSVMDVVMMGRTARMGYFSMPGKQEETLALENLEFLNVTHLKEKPYTAISGGERQLVMIAAALTQEPELLILDEPTAHLDFGNQYRFLELVLRLQERGMGVIMSTHSPDHALLLKGTTLIFKDGRLWHSGLAENVITEETMSELYRLEVRLKNVGDRTVCVPGAWEEHVRSLGSRLKTF